MARTLFAVILLVLLPCSAFANGPAPHLFFDDFTGAALGQDWTVQRPDPNAYALSEGVLTTQTLPGDTWKSNNDYGNLFQFQIPGDLAGQDFMVTLKVSNFNPTQDFQQIDLMAYSG